MCISSVLPRKVERGEEGSGWVRPLSLWKEGFSSSRRCFGVPKAGDHLDATVVQLRLLYISFYACNLWALGFCFLALTHFIVDDALPNLKWLYFFITGTLNSAQAPQVQLLPFVVSSLVLFDVACNTVITLKSLESLEYNSVRKFLEFQWTLKFCEPRMLLFFFYLQPSIVCWGT